jgi:hypothetical protein
VCFSDDDFSESTGYHCALPLEVHGAGYAQLQMISNTKAGKLVSDEVTDLFFRKIDSVHWFVLSFHGSVLLIFLMKHLSCERLFLSLYY